MNYKYNAPWDPLKQVYLGRSYDPRFFEDVHNSQIRDVLQRIVQETEEDYQNIQHILEGLGVEVLRPNIQSSSIMDFVDQKSGQINYANAHSFTLIPRPPMQPRDSQLIVGDRLIGTNIEISAFDNKLTVNEHTDLEHQFDAPLITVIGNNLIVDRRDHHWLADWAEEKFLDRRITPVDIGGHNDAVFAPVCPGAIISTYDQTNYHETFPGWEVLYIENQSWDAVKDWRKFKHSNRGKWWLPGEQDNSEFINFVETWLTNWLGYVEETVFDVNMLVVNDQYVLVNNYNKLVFDFLNKHGLKPIIAPFRHRFFWDGGIHCITSDLYREGEAENYINKK